jgi:serine/threonine-protein kinase
VDWVKVLDFGLVKHHGAKQPGVGATAEGEIAGTPAYMAPEMATGEVELDCRADLYALGCVAYWLLTGKLVFEGVTPMQVAVAHATQKPVPPSERCSRAIPAKLESIVLACLEKNPDDRPQTALALAEQLERLQTDLPSWTPEKARTWWRDHLPKELCEGTEVAAASRAASA